MKDFLVFAYLRKRHTLESWEWCQNARKLRFVIPSPKTQSAYLLQKKLFKKKIEFSAIFRRCAHFVNLAPCIMPNPFIYLISKSLILHNAELGSHCSNCLAPVPALELNYLNRGFGFSFGSMKQGRQRFVS